MPPHSAPATMPAMRATMHVDAPRQVERERHPAGGGGGHQHLAAAADVEHADAEGQRHAEAGRDQRRRECQRLGERPDAAGERVARRSCRSSLGRARRRRPTRHCQTASEHVARPREEVARRLLHAIVGERDHDAADDQREHDREHRDDRVALRDLRKVWCHCEGGSGSSGRAARPGCRLGPSQRAPLDRWRFGQQRRAAGQMSLTRPLPRPSALRPPS